MDNRWKVISFYTPKYSEVVKDLICSLEKFGIQYDIEKIEPKGTWLVNCNYKPCFIKEKILFHKCSIVWLDADAVIKQYPKYFDIIEEDVAAYCRIGFDVFRFISSTLFFKYNERVLDFLDEWIKRCENAPRIFDQMNLQDALSTKYFNQHKINLFFLPHSYCQIFDLMDWGEPIILQTQASRKLRDDR